MASYSNESGFDIIFSVGESVTGPYHDIGEPFNIVVEPGHVAITLRGGGQSTTEWDWVRGKAK